MKIMLFLLTSLIIHDITPKESLRFQYCHEQGFDTSCGLTVVTSALNHYWGIDVTELELIEKVLGSKTENENYTVNLADIAKAIELYGISTKAFRLDWDGLKDTIGKGYAPIIVHYEKPQKHFALLLGIKNDMAITVDPARGLESLSMEKFQSRYSGVAMLLAAKGREPDRNNINGAIAWASGKQLVLDRESGRVGIRW